MCIISLASHDMRSKSCTYNTQCKQSCICCRCYSWLIQSGGMFYDAAIKSSSFCHHTVRTTPPPLSLFARKLEGRWDLSLRKSSWCEIKKGKNLINISKILYLFYGYHFLLASKLFLASTYNLQHCKEQFLRGNPPCSEIKRGNEGLVWLHVFPISTHIFPSSVFVSSPRRSRRMTDIDKPLYGQLFDQSPLGDQSQTCYWCSFGVGRIESL